MKSSISASGSICTRWALVPLLLLLFTTATSWANLPTDTAYLADFESGVAEFDAGNYTAADIHLKNALQKNSAHLPSRLLLGRTQLKLGRAPDAEKELLIALRMGAAKDRVVIPLGNALLLQRKHRDMLERITVEGLSNAGRYEVLTLRGRAYQELGELDNAHRSFDQAISFNPTQKEAYLGKSRTYTAAGDIDSAEKWLDKALDNAPESDELLYEKANLLRRRNDNEGAMKLYEAVIAANPNHMRARLGRASLNLSLGHWELSQTDSEYVHNRIPQDPDAALLYAQALSRQGQSEKAKEVLEMASESLSRIDERELLQQPGLLRIAALISLQQGVFDRANQYLERYVELVPHEVRIRVISARVKLQLGDLEGALQMLEPVYKSGTQDADLFGLLGEVYLRENRFDEAQAVLEQAAHLQPNLAPEISTRLALSKFGTGEGDGAWQDLASAYSNSEGSFIAAGIIMAIVQARTGNYDQALAIAQELTEREPDNPILQNLIGIVYLGRNDIPMARAAFEKAVKKHETFIPAMYNLGLIELQAGRMEGAEKWFNQVIQIKPQQPKALTGLAEIYIFRDEYDKAVTMLQKATAAKSDNLAPHIRLIEILLSTGRIAEAQQEGSTLISRHRDSARVFELLAQVEIAAGNWKLAKNHLRSASSLATTDGQMQLRIADQLIELKDYQAARQPLVLALTTDQKMAAQERLVQLYLRQGEKKNARSLAAQVRKEEPDSSLGYRLDALIFQTEGKYEEALSAYQSALELEDNRDVLLSIYKLHERMGSEEEGFRLLQEWTGKYPQDEIAQRILALGYLKVDRRDEARVILEKLVDARPNDALVLAGLAQLYLHDDNPKARALAERAVQAAPNWSIAQDTYGWILVREGEAEEGLKYLREAIARDSNPLIRYHLAAALHDLNRTSEAATQLEIILRLSPAPPWIESAQQLYDSINTTSEGDSDESSGSPGTTVSY